MIRIWSESPVDAKSERVDDSLVSIDGYTEEDWNNSTEFPMTMVLFKNAETLLLRSETLSYHFERELPTERILRG